MKKYNIVTKNKYINNEKNSLNFYWRKIKPSYKILITILITLGILIGIFYGFGSWYQQKHKNQPITLGMTFIADYASYLGVDPHKTMLALRDDLGYKHFRLVSYWNDIESTQGNYDFTELDWEVKQVSQVHGSVSLAIGLRQPRWPECHIPTWAQNTPTSYWYPKLLNFMTAVATRYKDNPTVTSYQLENEYFLNVFANCPDSTRPRLIEEFNLVKKINPSKPVIISLSNNYIGFPTGQPRPDIYGVSVYKRVWDKNISHRYFEYPFPSWWYSARAGVTELLTGKPSVIHELQAEPWPPKGINDASQTELAKSMTPKLLRERIKYAEKSGINNIDLWGGEWWYEELTKYNNPGFWNVAKDEMKSVRNSNMKLHQKLNNQQSLNTTTNFFASERINYQKIIN